jgi:hypothetical protein
MGSGDEPTKKKRKITPHRREKIREYQKFSRRKKKLMDLVREIGGDLGGSVLLVLKSPGQGVDYVTFASKDMELLLHDPDVSLKIRQTVLKQTPEHFFPENDDADREVNCGSPSPQCASGSSDRDN